MGKLCRDRPRRSLALGVLMMLGVPLGRLPGDFMVRRGNVSFYFPLVTLASVLSIAADAASTATFVETADDD